MDEKSNASRGLFRLSPRIRGAACLQVFRRGPNDPLHRPVRVFALDPAASLRSGAVATINVPFESLTPGPVGARFAVRDVDQSAGVIYHPVDLDSSEVLIGNGLKPSVMDPQSHQQMVYAVAMKTYDAFRIALGRELQWGFNRTDNASQLELCPHHRRMANGFYDRQSGQICFGYYEAVDEPAGRNLPRGIVFTCLSHDVIVHEVTHAVLDGLRPGFNTASNPDVLAFHEGFSDLVAVFQRFTYPDIVKQAIGLSRGAIDSASLLTDVARQFGHTIGRNAALRSAIDTNRMAQESNECQSRCDPVVGGPVKYGDLRSAGPHALGGVLLSAVFDAFSRIFERKTRRFVRIATGGSGVLPQGELQADLLNELASAASTLANQFLTICIRAIDYCPPVDITFGDFLRALITADYDLIQEDPWGYREALVDAFRMRDIFPTDVSTLSEESLRWNSGLGSKQLRCAGLKFSITKGDGASGGSLSREEHERRASAIGRLATDPENASLFGLCVPGNLENMDATGCGPVIIESLRTSQRVGPDGQVQFDFVAELTQECWIEHQNGCRSVFSGGSTVILDPFGSIRYIISKNVLSFNRQVLQEDFANKECSDYWAVNKARNELTPVANSLRLIHESDD